MTDDPVKQAWQASVEIAGAPPLDDVRKEAGRFYRKIRLRNRIEYVAGSVAAVVFAVQLFGSQYPHLLHKVGLAMLVAAAIYMPWQLHRRGSAMPPEMAGAMPIYDFVRAQMARQRDALKSVFWWYLLPWLPGMAFIFAGNGLDPKIEAAGPPIWARWLVLAAIAVFFGGVWWLNQLGARKLQRRIDEIDALRGESE